MKTRKIISVLITLSMIMTGVKVSAQEDIIDKIVSAKNGAIITELLDADDSGESGLDLSDYKKLKYREYIGNAIYDAPHSNPEEIKDAFNNAMSEALKEKIIDTFSIGAVLNTTGEKSSDNDVEGLQFKSGIIRNGNTTGISGYVIYENIEFPYAIVDIRADVTGHNKATATNNREISISGFTTDPIPSAIKNTNALKTYSSGTGEYKTFIDYVDTFTGFSSPVKVVFENGSTVAENIDLSVLLPWITENESEFSSLVLKLSDARQRNSLNAMKLKIKYDMTIQWEKQLKTVPANGKTGVKDIVDFEFAWREAIDTSYWNKENVILKINGERADYSLSVSSPTLTYVKVAELVDEAYYEIYLRGIKTADKEIKDRVIHFKTTRSKDFLPTAEIVIDGVSSDNIEVGSVVTADYIYEDKDGDKDTLTTYGWYVSDTENGKYSLFSESKKLEVSDGLLGKFVRFEVMPANSYATGERVVSQSYRITLPIDEQNVIDKINNADIYSIESIIKSNLDILGIEVVEVANPSYIYVKLTENNYLTVSQFKKTYEEICAEFTPHTDIKTSYGASFNDTGKDQNGVSIYNGLSFVEKPSNGFYDTSSYFWFELENCDAIKNGSITMNAQHTNDRTSYITGFSFIEPPFIGKVNDKIPPEDERFLKWREYVESDFIKLKTPVVFKHSGVDSVTVDIPEEILSAINSAGDDSLLVIEFSKPESGCANNNVTGINLALDYDLTKSAKGECVTIPENFEKGVCPVDTEYVINFQNEVNTENAEISVVNVENQKGVSFETEILSGQIKILIKEELLQNTLYCVSVKNIEGMNEIVRYFTTDSLVENIDIFTETVLTVGKDGDVNFVGYDKDGESVAISGVELSSSDKSIAETGNAKIKANKRGTVAIKAVHKNYDGSEISESSFVIIGNIIKSEDFENYPGADSLMAYSGKKSLNAKGKTVIAKDITKKSVLNFYDNSEGKGKIYLESENASLNVLENYMPSKGWHQLYCDNGEVYIDANKVASVEFSEISVEGIRVDSFFEVDTEGSICTASDVIVRGANASLTSVYEGSVLYGSYSYNDADGDDENGTVKEWYKLTPGGEKIKVGEGESLNTAGLRGYQVVFAITPGNIYEKGEIVYSKAVSVVEKRQSSGGGGGSGYTATATIPDLSVDYSEQAKNPETTENFDDVSVTHWAYPQIEKLSKAGIIKGRENNLFYPDDNITRAEFIKLLVYALDIKEGSYNGEFIDVSSDDWYAGVVKAASDNGLTKGYEDGSFAPDKNITREEMTKLVCVAAGVSEEISGAMFEDDSLISSWAKGYVYSAVAAGLVNGMNNNIFAPGKNATRAQATVIISRLIDLKEAGR